MDPVEELSRGYGGHRNATIAPPLEEHTQNHSPAFDIDQDARVDQRGHSTPSNSSCSATP